MLSILLKHEILNILKSRRVYWTVLIFLLLFASVFIVRVTNYQKQLNQYIADVKTADESLQKATNYSYITPYAIQQPLVFSIYNEGLKIPRVVNIKFYEPITYSESLNEELNLYYIKNTKLDITFLITFFLSLFILLISYDSVNGEKQVGTLRILMTYPLKRQTFILKKILGVFIFVAFTFTIPYFLSLIVLVVIYANLLTLNFFLSVFFYWFLVLLFIFFFSLLGIFISTCTANPSRSLVYSLLVWIMFAIILPISWDYIAVPKLYSDQISSLNRIVSDKQSQLHRIMYTDVPDDVNRYNVSYMHWYGDFYHVQMWSFRETHELWYRFQKYIIDNYYPVSRQAEQAKDEVFRKQISVDNVKNWVFFFNPIVLFENLSAKIGGNSREDYLKLLQDSRNIRDELVNLGISEGWLLDYRFFAVYKEEYSLGTTDEIVEIVSQANGGGDIDSEMFYGYVEEVRDRAERFEFEMPYFRRYEQPQYTFGEIFGRIWVYLGVFVGSILGLWVMTWRRFMTYDVR